jgi:heme-degrading monooxygenase HmoA
MYARTSTWSGSAESLAKWTDNCESRVRGFVEGLPGNKGVMFFVDSEQGQALTLTLWDTEAAATSSDQFAEQSRESTVAATGAELIARGRYEVVAGA